jgi:hypothetical protein
MKKKYTIQMNYNASIVVDVEVEVEHDSPDAEGKALEMARDIAEDADIREFTINGERESQILSVR